MEQRGQSDACISSAKSRQSSTEGQPTQLRIMAMTRVLATMACLAIVFNQAGSMNGAEVKYQIVEKDGYNLVMHPDAPVLGYSPDTGVGIITDHRTARYKK
jgi:hypothetical protein